MQLRIIYNGYVEYNICSIIIDFEVLILQFRRVIKGKYQRAASLLTTIDEEISTVSTNLSSKFKERFNVNYVKPFQVFYAL